MGNFARIGWGPVPNDRHDLGTDVFVQVRDDRGFSRGLFVGAQVKGGPSYFTDAVMDHDEVSGWFYYEPHVRHFEEWVQHGLPHLLVLHDLDERVSYWVHVTPTSIEVTGRGAKIFVPKSQTIDLDHLDDLMAVAATQREGVALEGTIWSSSIHDISPARWLRHALLVPRLVAPHPNRGTSRSIGWPEAVALLSQGRLRDLGRFQEEHDDVPSAEEAAVHREWGWRFVAAYGDYVTGGEPDLAAVLESAPNLESRCATLVLESCRLFDQEAHADAVEALSEAIHEDAAAPVDHAWLLIHRARHLAELSWMQEARQDAASAQRALAPETEDLTASLLRAAAGWLLFSRRPSIRDSSRRS